MDAISSVDRGGAGDVWGPDDYGRLDESDYWIDDPNIDVEPLEIERSSHWRWRRRGAMVSVIAGIALGVITFSFGSPVANYALTSENGLLSRTDDSSETDSDDQRSEGADPLSLFDPAASSAGVLGLYTSDVDGNLNALAAIATTTTVATTTTTVWTEPPIEPKSEWVNAGNGVAVPDVLLRIRFCESTNNYKAAHVASTARGAYQFLSGSWDWYGHAASYGVASADLATPAQQDEAAVKTLEQDGTRPWKESFPCWGSANINAGYATAKPPATTTTVPASTTSSTDGSTTSTDQATTTTQESTTSTDQTTTTTASTTTTEATTTSSESTSTSTGD